MIDFLLEIYNESLKQITLLQYNFNKLVSSNIRALDDDNSLMSVLIVLGISLIYGIIHALGPGHGKAIVGFYFLQNNLDKKEAFKIGYLIAIIHTISALCVTFVIYYILETLFSRSFHTTSSYATHISSVLIILIGTFLAYESIKNRYKQDRFTNSNKSKYMVTLSTGIIPCPGVMTITLFSVSLGHYILGIFSAIIMSIGMGFTISLVGILSVVFRDRLSNFLSKKVFLLQFFSAIFIIIIGLLLYNSCP